MSRNGTGEYRDGDAPAGTDALFARLHARAAEIRGRSALTLDEWVNLAEASRIAQALREARGNRSAAARSLGIGRRTLYTKMQKLGVHADWQFRPARDG
jgi:DNA-binding NtrC family response regulator